MRDLGFNFPLSYGGRKQGINDSGIHSFAGNPINSLVREILQNSTDAKKEGEKKVKVSFKLDYFSPNEIFKFSELQNALINCEGYLKGKNGEEFFRKAVEISKRTKIPVLKISDYYTTGLRGSDSEEDSEWENLVKREGSSDKGGSSGGSFGIGKNATFACSNLRTVFYGTKDDKGLLAFQGVSKLISFPKDGDFTQGTGYYGDINGNKPIYSFSTLNNMFHRDEVGTDIFVLGFSEPQDWKIDMIKCVLENFFIAIHNGLLEVEIGDEKNNTVINQATLEKLLNTYSLEGEEAYAQIYYQALTSDKKIPAIVEDYKGLGEIELHLIFDEFANKRIAMVRSTGMKIIDKGNFRIPQKFSGVLIAKGEKINRLLRYFENPSHDKWEGLRNPEKVNELLDTKKYDAKIGEKFLTQLYSWVASKMREFVDNVESDSIDLKGLSEFLPDDNDEDFMSEEQQENGDEARELEVKNMNHKSRSKKSDTGIPNWTSGNEEDGHDSGGKVVSTPGENGGKKGGKDGSKKTTVAKEITVDNVRCFSKNPKNGEYKITFTPDTTQKGYIYVYLSGEENSEKAVIIKAKRGLMNSLTVSNGNRIGPINLQSGKKEDVSISLKDKKRYALEVIIREN